MINGYRLDFPTDHHQKSAELFKQEFFDAGEYIINGSALLNQMDYDTWLKHVTLNHHADTVS